MRRLKMRKPKMRKQYKRVMASVLLIAVMIFVMSVSALAEDSAPQEAWKERDLGWRYENKDGTYPASQWKQIGEKWYHFDASGYMRHGWFKVDNKWYYLGSPNDDESGAMRHGWFKENDKWYYLGSPDNEESGAMRHGWFKVDNKWYYLGSPDNKDSGAMAVGWRKINDKWYYFSQSGAMKIGWQKVGEKWYYFAESGAMAVGWRKIDDRWYYFAESGAMQRGWLEDNEKWYYLGWPDKQESGAMRTGLVNTSQEESETPKYYYLDENGAWKTDKSLALNVDGYDYIVRHGEGKLVETEEDQTLFRAIEIVNSVTTDDMTDDEKLLACFEHVKSYPEFLDRIPYYTEVDWPVYYANNIFVGTGSERTGTKGGSCFAFAAAFAYLAKGIGYDDVYACNSGGHGWAEVNGLIYDPEWDNNHPEFSYYALSYDTTTTPNYKAAISAGYDYMHVAI
ncbi:MAG: N-acetylmuramoyl-L-alanine amidase family protein [Firmicutes bacterium]|nr:N-acetylmuramoyl-L-alanine amidase family protein [Bacillota bacterium]